MALTFFWIKVLMWNRLLPVVHNDYSNPLSKHHSIRYQLVLLVDWLKLVGKRLNEVERNLDFFHVEAPPSSTRNRHEVRGRSWLVTFAHLVPLNDNATFSVSVNFFVDQFYHFSSCFGVAGWDSDSSILFLKVSACELNALCIFWVLDSVATTLPNRGILAFISAVVYFGVQVFHDADREARGPRPRLENSTFAMPCQENARNSVGRLRFLEAHGSSQ